MAGIIAAGDLTEAMTHATAVVHVERFTDALANASTITCRHAAGSALLGEPAAWLDAVRPGLALYDDAVRVTARLVDVRESLGRPAGYTGFHADRYGVILARLLQWPPPRTLRDRRATHSDPGSRHAIGVRRAVRRRAGRR